jgi:tetratricopeptide (TPR) repeat protein
MTGQDSFQHSMDLGHSAAWEQQWAEAADHYRKAVTLQPENVQALSSLALALYELEDFESALENYKKVSVLQPNDPVSLEKIARIYERIGRLKDAVQTSSSAAEAYLNARDVEKAIQNWLRAVSLDPEDLSVRTRLASIYDRMGRKADAVLEYMATASLMQRTGNIDKAIQVVEYIQKLVPDYPEARQAMEMLKTGQLLPKVSRPRGGTGPVRMAEVKHITKKPTAALGRTPIEEAQHKALVDLAGILFEQDDSRPNGMISRRGITALTRGTGGLTAENADRSRIQMHVSQAIDSQTKGEDSQAIEELERATETGLNTPAVHFTLGCLLAKRSDPNAFRYLQRSVRHPEYALASNLLMGDLYRNAQKWKDAATTLLQAFALADSITVPEEQGDEIRQLYEPIIESQTNQQNDEGLQTLCTKIMGELNRTDWRDHLLTARAQMPAGEGDTAAPLIEMMLESRSSGVVEALASIRQLTSHNMLRSAMEEAFYAIQYAPTYLPLHVQIGDLLVKEGRLPEAVDKFMLTAQLYSLRGESNQAARLLRRASQMAPMDLSLRSKLVEILTAQGKMEEAMQQYIELGDIYYRLAELDMARQTYLSALKLIQQSPISRKWALQILSKVADIDLQRLDWRSAIKIYEQLRTMDPEDPQPRAQLIDLNIRLGQSTTALAELDAFMTLLENNNQRKKAIQFLTDFQADHPDQLQVRMRLATLYVHDKQIDKACEVMDSVATAFEATGDRSGAMNLRHQIVALNPSNLEKYKKALDELEKTS